MKTYFVSTKQYCFRDAIIRGAQAKGGVVKRWEVKRFGGGVRVSCGKAGLEGVQIARLEEGGRGVKGVLGDGGQCCGRAGLYCLIQ